MSDPYILLTAPGVVELWSTVRLPYEPQGWLLEMRDRLQLALHDLSQTSSGQLHATYMAADDGALVDIENVLLYNVRGTAFGKLTKHSVNIERGYRVPPPLSGAGFEDRQAPLHYHRYSTTNETPRGLWEPGDPLAAFTDVPLDGMAKPAPVWKAIRDHGLHPGQTARAPVRFHVDVQIVDTRSVNPAGSVFGLIKPVLDGIISAYHSHADPEGIPDDFRLVKLGLGTADELREMLLDPRWAALGPRRQLLKPHGASGVQWNPADDYCVFAHVARDAAEQVSEERHPRWRLSAKLTEASSDVSPQEH